MVKVTHDGEPPTEPKERCCFCRVHTSYWYQLADIACCEACAKVAEPGDFPTKAQWCRRERIAENINRPFGR